VSALFTVLPPIPTTGLSTDDVNALAARIREQMIAALREISVPVPDDTPAPPTSTTEPALRPTSPQDVPKTVVDERVSAGPGAPVPPAARSTEAGREEARTAAFGVRDESMESLSSSSAGPSSDGSRRQESEAGAETEEDEGMVLVGRPHA
jgi:lysophosphatidate acyltransferase